MTAAGSRRGRRARARRDGSLVLVATLVALLPLVVGAVRALLEGAAASNGDVALIELMVRDVGTDDTPLLGSYQRYGWNQPGPLLFYLLAAPYRLLGARFVGLQVGALLLNAASVVGIAVVAARRGGTVLALWALLLTGVLAWGLGAGTLADPWEPHVSVLPTALLVLLAFDVAAGRAWALPVAAGVASVLAQAYAAQATTSVLLVVWALVALAVPAVRGGAAGRRALLGPLVVTVAVVAVLWAPPLAEQVGGDPGNLTEAWRFLREPRATLGLGDAWSAVSLQLDHRAPWLGADVPLVFLGTTVDVGAAPAVPVALLAAAAGLALAAWRRDRSALLGVTALVLVGGATLGLSRLVGELFPWIVMPTRVVGFACWLAAGWCAYAALGDGARQRLDRVLAPLLAVGVVAVATAGVVDAVTADDDDPLRDAQVELAEAGAAEVAGVEGPVLVRADAPTEGVVFGEGVTAEVVAAVLEREGVDVVVDEGLANRFGEHRARPADGVAELRLVSGRPEVPGFRRVASADPVGEEDRARRERLRAAIERRTGGTASLTEVSQAMEGDPELRDLVEELDAIPDLPRLSLLLRGP